METLFGEMAKYVFSSKDSKRWCNHSDVEANFTLKHVIDEVFFHGLNLLAAKDARVKHLESSIEKLITLESLHHEELIAFQTKVVE